MPIEKLIPNPDNPNKHTEEQIKMLAKIINYQGWTSPITISKRSGFISKGEARFEAAKVNGWKEVPVDILEYESPDHEHADMIADNEIARMAIPDMMKIQELALKLPKNFDFDLLGIPNFFLREYDKDGNPLNHDEHWAGMPEFDQQDKRAFRTIIVHCIHEEAVKKFEKLVGQELTEQTKYIWFPETIREKVDDKRYAES